MIRRLASGYGVRMSSSTAKASRETLRVLRCTSTKAKALTGCRWHKRLFLQGGDPGPRRSNPGNQPPDLRATSDRRRPAPVRPSDVHLVIRSGILMATEMTRGALAVAGSCATLPLKVVFLALSVLVLAGCSTETPPAAPPVSVPEPGSVAETTRAPTWTAWPKPTEVDPRVTELKTWRRALDEVILDAVILASTGHRVDQLGRKEPPHQNRLLPLRGARERMEAAIARVDVPREAVAIDVGCGGSDYGASTRADLRTRRSLAPSMTRWRRCPKRLTERRCR